MINVFKFLWRIFLHFFFNIFAHIIVFERICFSINQMINYKPQIWYCENIIRNTMLLTSGKISSAGHKEEYYVQQKSGSGWLKRQLRGIMRLWCTIVYVVLRSHVVERTIQNLHAYKLNIQDACRILIFYYVFHRDIIV